MVGMGLLNSTDANVVVATHTSIALTDAFAAEVTVLDKTRGKHRRPRSNRRPFRDRSCEVCDEPIPRGQ